MSATIAHRIVTGMILANLPVAAWVELTGSELAEHLDLGLLAFFGIEITVRVIAAVRRRSWDFWLVADAAIILLALTPLGFAPVARTARLAHLGRHVQHLRHVTVAKLVHA